MIKMMKELTKIQEALLEGRQDGINEERKRILSIIKDKRDKEWRLYNKTALNDYYFACVVLDDIINKIKEIK